MKRTNGAQDIFQLLEEAVRSGGAEAAFDLLTRKFQEEKKYWLLFEVILMKKRHELGLSLIRQQSLAEIPKEVRSEYERGYVEAARQVGQLFLGDADLPKAWPYFRAIGEIQPIAAALESLDLENRTQEEIDALIEIAFQEGVHPRKGIELILEHYGLCRAITNFSRYPSREGREDCIRLLVQRVYHDLRENLRIAVARREDKEPTTDTILELISDRDWLFDQRGYYIDSSHLSSVVRYGLEIDHRETLTLVAELTEYGKRLDDLFQPHEHPPFDQGYQDYDVYVRALLGQDVNRAVTYFLDKVTKADPSRFGSYPAQIVVGFLTRVGRFHEAIDLFLRHVSDVRQDELHCPSLAQLCDLAHDPKKLTQVARERMDLLDFAAGLLQMEQP